MASDTDPPSPTLLSRRTLELATAAATALFGLAIIRGALEFPVGWTERGPDPGYFPFWIGCVIILGSIGAFVEGWLGWRTSEVTAITRDQGRRALLFLLPMVAFVGLTSVLGIYVAMLIYLFFVMVTQGGYRVDVSAAVAAGTALFFFLMFDRWLRVPLAKGPLEAWLGLH